MVADGMGGSRGGDIAAAMALRSIRDDLRRAQADSGRHGRSADSQEARAALVVGAGEGR
jgi:serine/threonine protein phosphatase PrpC